MTTKELIQNHLVRQVYLSNAEIAEIFSPRFDYENACMSVEDREFHVDLDEANDKYFWWEAISNGLPSATAIEVLREEPDRVDDWNNESDRMFFSEQEAWRDCTRSNQIVPDEVEVLEVWLVSDWLHDRLERQNESVVNWKGLPLWGRTSTGLPLDREDVIEVIAKL